MEKRILEEQVTYESGLRVHRQVIERRTSKAEDMLEVAQLHNTLGRLEGQIETLKSKVQLDPEYEASYTQQIKKLLADQEVIRQAIEIHNQYIEGFNRE